MSSSGAESPLVIEVLALAETLSANGIRGASDEAISALQTHIGMVIPADLWQWLSLCNVPRVESWDIYGISPENEYFDIESRLRVFTKWRHMGWIPIAGDGVGNYFVLEVSNSACSNNPVLFIDHEIDYNRAIYVAASGLWLFWRFLFRRELGSQGWPFSSEFVLADDPALARCNAAPKPWDIY